MRKKASPKKTTSRSDTSTKKRKAVVRKKKAVAVKKSRVPKTRGGGKLTESQYFAKIRSALRDAFRWWPPMQEALRKVSRPAELNKRAKTEYQCAHCLEWKVRTGVQIDHITECGSLKCYDDLVPFIQRLTMEDVNAYQILCKPCHKVKTQQYRENAKG